MRRTAYILSLLSLIFCIYQTQGASALPLENDTVVLDEVVVKARQRDVKWDGPKLTADIQSNSIFKERNAFDILNLLPGVFADSDGSITVIGKSASNIIVNGRRVRLGGEQLALFLRSLKGADLKDIQIQTNKTAESDGSMGDVTITINRLKHLDTGFSGWLGAGYERTNRNSFTQNANFSFYTPKVNVYANMTVKEGKNYSEQDSRETTADLSNVTSSSSKSTPITLQPRVGLDYDISRDHYLGLEWQGGFNNTTMKSDIQATSFTPQAEVLKEFIQKSDNSYKSKNNNVTFNYKFRLDSIASFFSVNADWTKYNSNNKERFRTDNIFPQPYEEFLQQPSDEKIDMLSAQADFGKILGKKWFLSVGMKYVDVRTKYFKEFLSGETPDHMTGNSEDTNDFRYHESIGAAYANVNFNSSNWMLSAGIRAEYTWTRSKLLSQNGEVNSDHYCDFFPNASIYRNINSSWIGLNYTQWIMRPQYMFVNPFKNYRSEISYVRGNPDLKPVIYRNVSLNAGIKGRYYISLMYQKGRGLKQEQYFVDDEDKTYRTFVNSSNYDRLSFGVICPVHVGIWNSNNSLNLEWRRYSWDDLVRCNWTYSLSSSNSFRWNSHWSSTVSLRFFSKSKELYVEDLRSRFLANIECTYTFYKGMFNLQFGVRDIFNSDGRYKNMFRNDQVETYSDIRTSNGRNCFASLTWYFSKGLKKKITRKERTNDEERRRI